jgi:hypothetical protein
MVKKSRATLILRTFMIRQNKLLKRHSLFCIRDVKDGFQKLGFDLLFYESRPHRAFSQHHIVWQKSEVK